jgi:large subunit ribosomal protein L2
MIHKNNNTTLIKKFNPVTPSLRNTTLIKTISTESDDDFIVPKYLFSVKNRTGGRDNNGHISVRHIGGGNKVKYRKIAFRRSIFETKGIVKAIHYDPNRNVPIALVKYDIQNTSTYEYHIATEGVQVGSEILNSNSKDLRFINSIGSSFKLSNIITGTTVCLIEIKPGHGAQIARSAGSYAILSGKENDMAILKMPSGETRKVPLSCFATIGQVANAIFKNIKYGKAGRMKWLNTRPSVRGIAMNPVDHHNGGRTNGGTIFTNPNGRCPKGLITRSRKKPSNKMIVSKRKK